MFVKLINISMKKFPKNKKSQKERMRKVLDIFSALYPNVTIQLNFTTPHELLVATMLSAQCTDARVNKVTKDLFKKYIIPEDFLKVDQEELELDIFSTGFYKAKAKNIQAATKIIVEEYNGEIPADIDILVKLPGVGRKTANVVLGHCFGIPGIVVDTHVIRINNLLEFVDTKNAVQIEKKLNELIPKEEWLIFTHYMINHGRNTCIARRPKCNECPISELCPSSQV